MSAWRRRPPRSIYIGINIAFLRHIAEIGSDILSRMSPTRLITFAGALGLAIVAVMGLGLGLAYLLAEFS